MGIFLALWVFEEQATIVMILLTVMAAIPLMYNTLKFEEDKDLTASSEKNMLRQHYRILAAFMFLFLGFVAAFSIVYISGSTEMVDKLFSSQTDTISEINSKVTGVEVLSGSAYSEGLLLRIFSNNLKVMLFCVFFSFFFGSGAIFILTWNASVISAAIGNFFRTNISDYAMQAGFIQVAGYFHIYSLSLLRYFVHGLPEILAYFIGGLAGGIISVAVIKHDFSTRVFGKVLRDALHLILLGIVVLFIAGLLEVYVTPLLVNF
ncbi:MAG: stage II sporulation protein M [Nanoarchaeota archaeon]|nr:stage II sporulation protein M [Nanoarchaeota archaeon]